MRHLLCIPVFFSLVLHASLTSASTLPQPLHFTWLSGTFEQQRELTGVARPFASSGHFLVEPDLGLLWVQEVPFGLTLVFKQDVLIQQTEGGEDEVLMVSDHPVLEVFELVLGYLLALDLEALTNYFKIAEVSMDSSGEWVLMLVAEDSRIASVFTQVTLRGKDFLYEAQLKDTSGDSTRLFFSDQQLSHSPLPEADRARFFP